MKTVFGWMLWCFLGLSGLLLQAQTPILDSLLKNYEFANAKAYILQQENSQNNQYLQLFRLFAEKKELDSAYHYFYQIDTLSLATFQRAQYYFYEGQLKESANEEDLAFPLYQKAQQLFEKAGADKEANQLNYEFYSTINSQKQYEYPKQTYLVRFIAHAKANGYADQLATGYMEMVLQHLNRKDSVQYYFKGAWENANETKDPLLISRVAAINGLYHAEITQELDSAAYYFDLESSLLAQKKVNYRSLYNLINKANVAKKKGNIPQAIDLLLKADSIPHDLYRKNNKIILYTQLVDAYEQLGAFDKALIYSKRILSYRDSVNVAAQNVNLTRFQASEKENQLLIEQQQKKQNRNIAYALGGIAVLIGFIGFLVYKNTKRKQRIAEQERLLEIQQKEKILKEQELHTINAMVEGQEKERLRLASDLHDSVGATLSAAKLQFDHLSKTISEANPNDEIFQKTKKLLEDAYQEVRSMAHLKNSGVIAKNGLLPAVEKLATNASSKELHIEVSHFGLEGRLDSTLEITLFRIIQELVTNIIKHAKASEASISLTQREDVLSIIVEDNGIGFPANKMVEKNGMGLSSVETRVEHLEGTLEVDSQPLKGTSILIDIPL